MKVKETELDVEKVDGDAKMHGSPETQALRNIRKGNKIVATKEFILVFFITCFVPFIRPNFPIIKEQEIVRIKNEEKEKLKKKR